MPTEHPLRTFSVFFFLILIPGYLFLQALFVQQRPHRFDLVEAFAAVGISPVIVGLLALSTMLAPVGFRLSTVFVVVVVACLLLAVVAFARRWARLHPTPASAAAGPR